MPAKLEELKKIREVDRSAFICVECGEISTGWGARIGTGWACSSECYKKHVQDLQKERELKSEI